MAASRSRWRARPSTWGRCCHRASKAAASGPGVGMGRSSATGRPSRVTVSRSPLITRSNTSRPWFRRSRMVTLAMSHNIPRVIRNAATATALRRYGILRIARLPGAAPTGSQPRALEPSATASPPRGASQSPYGTHAVQVSGAPRTGWKSWCGRALGGGHAEHGAAHRLHRRRRQQAAKVQVAAPLCRCAQPRAVAEQWAAVDERRAGARFKNGSGNGCGAHAAPPGG